MHVFHWIGTDVLIRLILSVVSSVSISFFSRTRVTFSLEDEDCDKLEKILKILLIMILFYIIFCVILNQN